MGRHEKDVLREVLPCPRTTSIRKEICGIRHQNGVGVINTTGATIEGIVEVVVVQPPLPTIVQPLQPLVIIANILQVKQKERLLQDLKKLRDFYEQLVKHSTLMFVLKKSPGCGIEVDKMDEAPPKQLQIGTAKCDLGLRS
ncbi:hypothetical protein CR513_37996, partial [Mucuna pruriens]